MITPKLTRLQKNLAELQGRKQTLQDSLSNCDAVFPKQLADLESLLLDAQDLERELTPYSVPTLSELESIMAAHIFGPDLWAELGIIDSCDPFEPPPAITYDLLDSYCAVGHGSVKATNRLIYVPAGFSLRQLVEKADEFFKRYLRRPVAHRNTHIQLKFKKCANEEPAEAAWVLMPLKLMPGSKNLASSQQNQLLRDRFPAYDIAPIEAVFLALIGEDLRKVEQIWGDQSGRCQHDIEMGLL